MKVMQYKTYWIHLLACALFIVLPVLVSSRPPGEPFLTVTRPFIRDIIGNVLLLLFFYLNYYLLIPNFYFKKKYLWYSVFIVLCFALVAVLPSIFTGRNPFGPGSVATSKLIESLPPPGPNAPMPNGNFFEEVRNHIFLFIIVLFFSLLMRLRSRLFEERENQLHAELSYLKEQINPHFLFNTLNSIYALAIQKDDRTPDALINLAGLMRYVIKDANDNRIALQKELEYIQNYIELQKARLGETVRISFKINGQGGNHEIVPLILITYIENAFKYGVNPDEDSELLIDIKVQENKLEMLVWNKKVKTLINTISTGIGIKNTAARLGLLYPGKHLLTINDEARSYSVNLTIDLV